MGIADVRDAFTSAGEGKLTCTAARLRYVQDGNNSQILEFDGIYQDGASSTPFAITSGPFDPKMRPQDKAREMAEKFLKQQTAAPTSSATH